MVKSSHAVHICQPRAVARVIEAAARTVRWVRCQDILNGRYQIGRVELNRCDLARPTEPAQRTAGNRVLAAADQYAPGPLSVSMGCWHAFGAGSIGQRGQTLLGV